MGRNSTGRRYVTGCKTGTAVELCRSAGGRRCVVLLVSPNPTRSQRAIDALLGVRRRRRQLAYLAIIGGLRTLRPMLWRLGAGVVVVILTLQV
jgi:hypothetical protein